MSTILIIPSARLIAAEMQLDYGLIPPVLLPFGNSTSLDYILESFQYDECCIGLHDEFERVKVYIHNKAIQAKLVKIDSDNKLKSNQLGYSILYMLKQYELTSNDSLIINFGDTIVLNQKKIIADYDERNDFIFTSQLDDQFRWTTVSINEKIEIFDKNIIDRPKADNIIAGVMHIKNAVLFLEILKSKLESNEILFDRNDSFYITLEEYLNKRNQYNLISVREGDWIDLGHLDTFYKSKARFLNARHFNSFEIDLFWGKIRKTSNYKKKFIDEIEWYINLPTKLKSLIPNIYSYSIEKEAAFIEMEYYSYPTLSQIYLYSNISVSLWHEIFKKLILVHKEFIKIESLGKQASFKGFYFEKTKERLLDLKGNANFKNYFENKIKLNGKTYPSIFQMIDELEYFINNYVIRKEIKATVIHGDFCLSNILYDIKTGVLKLIDPRGSFIDSSIYGDPNYDLAKILHSVHGYYDLILTDNYTLEENEIEVSFDVLKSNQHETLSDIFLNLLKINGFDVKQILAIESLLFLSMVPLHSENIKRQKAFLMRGLELYYSIN